MDMLEIIEKNSIDEFTRLLDYHINDPIPYREETYLLNIMVNQNKIEIVKLLLSHPKINVNSLDELGNTSLYTACDKKYIEIIKILLQHPDIDVNLSFPLYQSCLKDYIEVVKLLLSHPKIDITIKNKMGKTCLDVAQFISKNSKSEEVVNLLINYGYI